VSCAALAEVLSRQTADDFGFVLFTPDATTTGVYQEAIARLEAARLRFVAFRWLRVDRELVGRLYSQHRSADQVCSREAELTDRLFCMDYSLAALLRAAPGLGERPVSAVVTALKGPSEPGGRRPHQLRVILGSDNPIVKFLHASDSSHHTLRETELFFPDGLPVADGRAPAPPADLGRRTSVSAWVVRHRLKERLFERVPLARGPRAALRSLLRQERELVDSRATSPGNRTRQEALTTLQAALVAPAASDPRLARGIQALAAADPWSVPIDRWLADLTDAGLVLSEWDELILRAQHFQGALP
jgi:nucleoside diphosphate kinase